MTLSKAGELRDRGFTLIELLVVCAILAATAYIAWGGFVGVQEGAEDRIAHAEMQRLADALQRFRADTGYYPGQGPFALAAPGTTETANGGGWDCAPVGGVLRSWALPGNDTERDDWFRSPLNLVLLFEAPALCANHPQAYLRAWNPDTHRGWHGPYLGLAARQWVDHGSDFNADASNNTGPGAGAPVGTGTPIAGTKVLDVPAFGNGAQFRAVGPQWSPCADQDASTGTCMLGWRSVPRSTGGYDSTVHELRAHARPFAVFGLADSAADNPARIVHFGPDGRYGGRNPSDACLPNTPDPDGQDDTVLCLGR
ncbi:MAG: prepilin-type N-terminal cleavage/methylation domain-containing protein [Rhodoferax sp.]